LKVGNSKIKQTQTQQSEILLDIENKNNIFQLSTINYQLSTINYQLSTINYQLSTINYQLFIFISSINANAKQNLPHITNKTNHNIYKNLQFEVL